MLLFRGWEVQTLVELVELASDHFKILKKLKFMLVCVRDSWLNLLNLRSTYIYSFRNYLAFSELGSANPG